MSALTNHQLPHDRSMVWYGVFQCCKALLHHVQPRSYTSARSHNEHSCTLLQTGTILIQIMTYKAQSSQYASCQVHPGSCMLLVIGLWQQYQQQCYLQYWYKLQLPMVLKLNKMNVGKMSLLLMMLLMKHNPQESDLKKHCLRDCVLMEEHHHHCGYQHCTHSVLLRRMAMRSTWTVRTNKSHCLLLYYTSMMALDSLLRRIWME